jgi:flagellar hook-length control protein FliK
LKFNNSNGTSSDPKQKQNLMEEQSSKLASQLVQTGDANISITTTTDKAIIFDKILESSQETKINSDSVLKQVSEKVSSEFKAGKSEITMSLRPESLGKVDINIVSEKGVITAQIITENSQVKDALNKEIDVLKQKLQDQGVNLDKVAVKVQEPAQTNNNHSNFDQDSQKFNQSNQNASTDFNSGKHTQEQTGTKQANYDSSDFNAETDPDTDTENLTSEVHNGMIDYRI